MSEVLEEELIRLYRIEVDASLIVNVLGDYLEKNLPVTTANLREALKAKAGA